jgi:hypothetical protein
MFYETNNCPIYVPAESVEAYKSAEFWSDYSNRIQAIPSIPIPEAIDLGLSVKWASFNLGASAPEEYGDYFAWGEIEPKDYYSWANYNWCEGSSTSLTKYCSDSEYGNNGYVDSYNTLELEDDAARTQLRGKWRMPTNEDFRELYDNCTSVWTTENGVKGRRFTSQKEGYTDKSIFLPAAGVKIDNLLHIDDDYSRVWGYYWSSSLSPLYGPEKAVIFRFYNGDGYPVIYQHYRYYGMPIRPVYAD